MAEDIEYYFIKRENNEHYPFLDIQTLDDTQNFSLMGIEFADPVPQKPVLPDFLKGSNYNYWFINKKIYDVINNYKFDFVKFIETKWIGKQKNITEKYWCLNVNNIIKTLDKEKSIFVFKYYVYKFVFDKKLLEKIPFEKKLIFSLEEAMTEIVFHKSVVDLIMAVNPTGLQFKPVEE